MPKVPYNLLNEQLLMGMILHDAPCRKVAVEVLKVSDWQNGRHKTIFSAVKLCVLNSVPIEKETVASYSGSEDFGGLEYLEKVFETKSITGFEACLEKLRCDAARADTLRSIKNLQGLLTDRDIPYSESIEAVMGMERTLRRAKEERRIKDLAENWIGNFENRCDGKSEFQSTGYDSLDVKLFEGFAKKRITIIAGRPRAGKSTFVVDIIRRLLESEKKPRMLMITLEGGSDKFMSMLISSCTGIEGYRLTKRTDELKEEEKNRIRKVARKVVGDDRLEVMDNPFLQLAGNGKGKGWTNDSAISKLEEILSVGKYDIVFMDLYQRMLTELYPQSITTALYRTQSLFDRMNVHGVLVHQLHRRVEDREKFKNCRPQLTDLKDSGSYEEVADLVLLVHREKAFKSDLKDVIEVTIAKQKTGEDNYVMLANFRPQICRLENEMVMPIEMVNSKDSRFLKED